MAASRRRKRKAAKTSEPKPAPGDLAIVQAFVNTATPGRGSDALATPEGLARWLARRRLLDEGTELGEKERRQALEARDGLRAMILDNHADVNGGDLRRLERSAEPARFGLTFDDDGRPTGFRPASGRFGDALGALVAIAAVARLRGLWALLKICARDGCRQAFFDASQSRTGKWCSARCGYRVRTAAYRRSGKFHKSW